MLTPEEARERLTAPFNINLNRWLEVPVRASVGLKGFFTVRLIDARTGLIKRELRFPNTITDVGMDALGFDAGDASGSYLQKLAFNYMAVGTGSTTPTQSDTSLENEVARTSDGAGIGSGQSSGPNFDYWETTTSKQFDRAEANANLTELGMFSDTAANGGIMWTRQLLRDANGDPTTITKTSDDILQIIYTMRIYPEKTVRTSTLTIDGTSTTLSRQPQEIDDQNEWGYGTGGRGLLGNFGSWGGNTNRVYEDNTPPGDFVSRGPASPNTNEDVDGRTFQSYSAGTFQKDLEHIIGVQQGNFATGLGAYELRHYDFFGAGTGFITFFDPKIPKTDTDELTLQVRWSWARQAV